MKLKYRLRRIHRTYKAGYMAFACGILDMIAAGIDIATRDYRYAFVNVGFAILISITGLMAVQMARTRRVTDIAVDKTWREAFFAGAKSYAMWLKEREESEH